MGIRTTFLRLAVASTTAVGLVAVGMPATATAGPAPVTAVAADGSITVTEFQGLRHKPLSKKWARWMETTATLKGTTIYGTTTVHAGGVWGYTGCVTVLYLDSGGTAIGQTPDYCYGVDGDAVGTAHRVETWSNSVDAGIAARTVNLDIVQYKA